MSANFLQGFLGTQQAGIEARNDITVAVRNWFANRNPLVTRLPYVPVERVDFLMYTPPVPEPVDHARRRGLGQSTTTGLTLGDCTFLMNHDVLELVDTNGTTERVQINGDPTGTNTVTVSRGVAGTTATTTLDDRDGRQPDRQQPQRRRGQPDRPDDDRRLPHAVLPDVPVPGADRRVGPDRTGPGDAGRHPDRRSTST